MSEAPPSGAPASGAPEVFRRALAAQTAGELVVAAEGYRATLAAYPDAEPAHHNLVSVLVALGRTADAEAALRTALALWPANPAFRMNLGLLRLAAGDYAAGLPLYEARRELDGAAAAPAFSFPEWQGEPAASLLVFPEQGLGDQIQFARYVPRLQAMGIAPTLACSPALVRLFEPLGVPLVPAAGTVRFARHDAWTLCGSLPLRLATTLADIPPPAPLRAVPRVSGGIGVVARGNPGHRNDANRSLPPAAAARLLAAPGAVSLAPEDTGAKDLQDTAEIIAGLDRVVSVDTAVAHLAASLGKPTQILLPAAGTDWRWLRERADSPWYPSARLCRQAPGEPWEAVVERALADG